MIRKATPQDRSVATSLIYSTMNEFGDAALGLGEKRLALKAIDHFFGLPRNRFSFDTAWVVTGNGAITGILVAFPGREYARRTAVIGYQLWRAYGFVKGIQLIFRSFQMANDKETEKDEFYISHIAVAPGSRRKGFGRELLRWADQLARENQFTKCSLLVEIGNAPAKTLYETSGFSVVQTVHTPQFQARFHTLGYHRMVKHL
jgi:ribosomal protein S18 acetylase RimI-like enzyme